MNIQEIETNSTIEDKAKDIYSYIKELQSLCSIMYSSINNEFNPPMLSDLENSLFILKEHAQMTSDKMDIFIQECSEAGLFSNK